MRVADARRILCVIFLATAFALNASAATPLFQAAVDFATDLNPDQAALGDFNLDGLLDVAVANQGSGTTNLGSVSILLNNGQGGFKPVISLTGFTNPVSVAVGDFNEDGKLDLAVVSIGVVGKQISILLGNGDGTFQTGTPISAGGGTNFAAVGDVNQDGHLDLLATISGQKLDGLSVSLGNGDGTFQPATVYSFHFPSAGIHDILSVGDGASFIVAGDFNHDGMPDVAESNLSGHVAVFLNSGNGVMSAPVDYATGANPESFVVADLNGDGSLDVAAACYGQSGGLGGQINVLLGNGDGTFTAGQTTMSHVNPTGIASLDFNADGKPDLVFSGNSNDTVTVLAGNGNGTFRVAASYDVGMAPQTVVASDFTGDGKSDLVISDGFGGAVTLLPAKGTAFGGARNYLTNNKPFSVAIADFNGDHIPDVAIGANNKQSVSILLGSGKGNLRPPVTYLNVPFPVAIAAADLNKDGAPDLVMADEDTAIVVMLNKGDGTFQSPVKHNAGAVLVALAVADLNGDGNLDVVAADNLGNQASVLLGDGKGGFGAAVHYSTTLSPQSLTLGDFNGDGKLDVALYSSGNGNPVVSLLFGKGDGTFQKAVNLTVPSPGTSIVTADFNLDGKADLGILYAGFAGLTSQVSILLGNGDGTFQAAQTTTVPPETGFEMTTGDFNGDGKPDVAILILQTLTLLEGKGDGTFQPPLAFDAGVGAGLATGDLNGDGKPDFAIASGTGATVLLHN